MSPFFWDRFPVSGACTSTRQQDHDSYFNDVECRGVLLATLGHDLGCPEADGVQFTDLQGAFVRAQQRHGSDKENTGLESTWPLGERRQDFFGPSYREVATGCEAYWVGGRKGQHGEAGF